MTVSHHKGILSSDNSEVVAVYGDGASGIISIKGDFEGVITVLGSSNGVTWAPRLIFKSGVGCLGMNSIENDGSDFDREYRVVLNGEQIKLVGSGWVDGTASVSITTSEAPALMFINGAVLSSEEVAIRDSRGFTVSSGVEPVTSGQVFFATIKNPADSGVNIILRRRLFSNDVADNGDNLEYVAYANPTFSGGTAVTAANLRGFTPPSAAEFKWIVDDIANIEPGGFLGTGEILPRGVPYARVFDFIVEPGNGIGFFMKGQGANIQQSVRLALTLEWYEDAVN